MANIWDTAPMLRDIKPSFMKKFFDIVGATGFLLL